jgi:hypothetical protein
MGFRPRAMDCGTLLLNANFSETVTDRFKKSVCDKPQTGAGDVTAFQTTQAEFKGDLLKDCCKTNTPMFLPRLWKSEKQSPAVLQERDLAFSFATNEIFVCNVSTAALLLSLDNKYEAGQFQRRQIPDAQVLHFRDWIYAD